MLQPNGTGWLHGYKNKTTIYAVYKRPTSDLGIHKVENEVMEKDIPCKWKSKARAAILILDKIDLKEYYM